MEKINGFGNAVLNHHPLGVAFDELRGRAMELVGEQHGGLFVAQVHDAELPKRTLIVRKSDPLVENLWRFVDPPHALELDPSPSGGRSRIDLLQKFAGSPTQSHELDPQLVQLAEMRIGGETRVEDQLRG